MGMATQPRPAHFRAERERISLTSAGGRLKIPAFHYFPMSAPCKHPIVKIVARQDDAEFVECQACGEVFDSVEFNDIALEEKEGLGAEEAEG